MFSPQPGPRGPEGVIKTGWFLDPLIYDYVFFRQALAQKRLNKAIHIFLKGCVNSYKEDDRPIYSLIQ